MSVKTQIPFEVTFIVDKVAMKHIFLQVSIIIPPLPVQVYK
jgi:hypothetical protein